MTTFTLPMHPSMWLEVPATAIRQEKEVKDMIVSIENPIDSTKKKLLDLINESGKTEGYKVNTQKSKTFWHTNNEISETEIRKKSHLIWQQEK